MAESEIPEDILKAAQAICAEFDPSDAAICVAIMRERERCAQIADEHAKASCDAESPTAAARLCAESIAGRIRQDNPNET
jgi:hypothetical protein